MHRSERRADTEPMQQLEEPTAETREPAVRVGVVIVALIVGLLLVSVLLTPKPARRMTPERCKAEGGVWRTDVIGHNWHCDRTG